MKILFLCDDFPPKSIGGAGIITNVLARGLKAAGHELSVVTTIQQKDKEGWREMDGMRVYDMYVDYSDQLSEYLSLHNRAAILKLENIFEQVKPDVIHAHNIHHYLSYYCLKLARRYTDKVFLTTHDAMAVSPGKLTDFYDVNDLSIQTKFSYKSGFLKNFKIARLRYNPFRNAYIKHFLNTYPKKIFPITDRLKEVLVANGIDGNKCRTIHYGIDLNGWNVPESEATAFRVKLDLEGKKVVFFGGRLSEAKGGRIMMDVLAETVKKVPNAQLLIAGVANPYTTSLLKYAEQLGVRDHISFTEWLSREDMKKAYAAADVVVTPSIYFDAFNLFNIEAGAAGKPVVGTCFGGTPEIVLDGKTGRIVNPRNIPMFADALASILNDSREAQALGMAGRERVQGHFSLERYVSETLEEYLK